MSSEAPRLGIKKAFFKLSALRGQENEEYGLCCSEKCVPKRSGNGSPCAPKDNSSVSVSGKEVAMIESANVRTL